MLLLSEMHGIKLISGIFSMCTSECESHHELGNSITSKCVALVHLLTRERNPVLVFYLMDLVSWEMDL